MKKKSIVGTIEIILILVIVAVASLLLWNFTNKNNENSLTNTDKNIKKITTNTEEERIIIVELSPTPSSQTIKKILEKKGYNVELYSFESFYNVYKTLDSKNIIFIGSSSNTIEIKLDKILKDLSEDQYNIIFLYDENSKLPLTLIRKPSVDIEQFYEVEVQNPSTALYLDYKLPTPIRHVKVVSSEFPLLEDEIYVERGAGLYISTPILYLSTASNVIVEKKPNGLVKIDDITTGKYSQDTLDSNGKFLYATWSRFTQPILFFTTKASSPTKSHIYVLCKKNPNGYYTSWVKVDSSGNINCQDLLNYKIGSVDTNSITIIDKSTGDTVAEIPWLVFASLDLNAGGTIYIFNPFVINSKIYPVFGYRDTSGKYRFIFDFLKESGETFIFSS